MKTKKYGLFVVLSAALLITALIASCVNPIDLDLQAPAGKPKSTSQDTANPASPITTDINTAAANPTTSKAYIKVNLDVDSNARTIMPGGIDLGTAIQSYKVFIYEYDQTIPGTASGTDITTNYPVTSGKSYKVTVFGYNSTTQSASTLIADGTSAATGIISTTGIQSVSVTLKVITDTGTGTFSWDVGTLPTNTTTATMTLAVMGGGAEITGTKFASPLDLVTNSTDKSGSETLKAGYYRITVTFSATDYQTISESVILHVYQNYTSSYTPSFPAALTSKLYTVSFNKNYTGATNDITPISSVNHGGKLTAAQKPTDPIRSGYDFVNWFIKNNANPDVDIPWAFNASTGDEVFGDLILYAIWKAGYLIGVNVSTQNPGQATWTFDGSTITLNGSNPTATVELDTTGATFTSIIWRLNGTTIPSVSSTGKDTVTLNRYTLNGLGFGNGTYKLTVEATVGTTPHSSETTAPINVTISWP